MSTIKTIQAVLVFSAAIMIAGILLVILNVIGPIATLGGLLFLWAMVEATVAYFDGEDG